MKQAILYTTHCPRCKILKDKLVEAGISFIECEDVDTMIDKGIMSAPAFEIDGKIYMFSLAITSIRKFKELQKEDK